MDTLLTVAIVAAAALWATLRLFRRRRPACGGSCAGCPAVRRAADAEACAPAPSALSLPSRGDGGR